MLDSLQNTIDSQYTISSIIMSSKQKKDADRIWIVVEASEDCDVYYQFVHKDNVQMRVAYDSEAKHNKSVVISTVKGVLFVDNRIKILGICDADYEKYCEISNEYQNILLTDGRDLEMMLLKSDNVKRELNSWTDGKFSSVYEEVIAVCRRCGYYRIVNEIKQYSITFRNIIKLNRLWDVQTHSLRVDWKNELDSQISSALDEVLSGDVYKSVLAIEDTLSNDSCHDICRGHDVIDSLMYALVHTEKYNKKTIAAKIYSLYTLSCFSKTTLYYALKEFELKYNSSILLTLD